MADAKARLRNGSQIRPKDGSSLDWLITGFGPFPRVAKNPSAALALLLAGRWRRLGLRVDLHIFKTAYASVAEDIPRLAQGAPRAVLMLGVAPKARALRVEQRAINRRAVGARDAGHALPRTPLIIPGGPSFRAGRHRGEALVRQLRREGVSAQISRDAGRYLCNFAYWTMLEALPGARIVFIHIPFPRGREKSGRDKHDARPTLDAMARALRAVIRSGL